MQSLSDMQLIQAQQAGYRKGELFDCINQDMAQGLMEAFNMNVNEGYEWLQQNTAGLDHFQTSRWLAGFYSVLSRRIYNALKEQRSKTV